MLFSLRPNHAFSALTFADLSFILSFSLLQERVEEERYIRSQEKIQLQKLREDLTAHEREAAIKAEEELFKNVISPVMTEIEEKVLKDTGDKVSREGLEHLARWKLDIK